MNIYIIIGMNSKGEKWVCTDYYDDGRETKVHADFETAAEHMNFLCSSCGDENEYTMYEFEV